MTTTGKTVTILLSLATLGIGGYFAYKYFAKKDSATNKDETKSGDKAGGDNVVVGTNQTTPTTPLPSDTTVSESKPYKLSDSDIATVTRLFQNWMDFNNPRGWVTYTEGGKKITGKLEGKTSRGYGVFGKQTKAAISKNKEAFAGYLLKSKKYTTAMIVALNDFLKSQGL